ncbi:MAG: glycine--tRNA ligase [bacterium]
MPVSMDDIVSLCKRRGIIFPGSEIYGGLGGTFDYGPIGVELKNNVKRAWWKSVVYERDDMEGLDAAILMAAQAWVASGHVEGFSDPLSDCKQCKKRFRADHVEEQELHRWRVVRVEGEKRIPTEVELVAASKKHAKEIVARRVAPQFDKDARLAVEEIEGSAFRGKNCPECGGELTDPRQFNLMFKTFIGPVEEGAAPVYLRPETAQGIFVNFDNVRETMRRKLPFGIAQIGKSFRNEITPRNFIFRTREFEQMEIEYFCVPGTDQQWHDHWVAARFEWYQRFGIRKENLKLRPHEKTELAHYAKSCFDIEYNFPIGWSELEGIANRTDFDLKAHMKHSGKDLSYFDPETKERFVPYVIEPSAGVDRSTLAFLVDSYREETVEGRVRRVLALHPFLSPIKCAVLPLLANRGELVELARKLCHDLKPHFYSVYDDTAAIGKLYRRQDEVGTPFCITVDVQTLEDHQVTVRARDTMAQDRISVAQVEQYLSERIPK